MDAIEDEAKSDEYLTQARDVLGKFWRILGGAESQSAQSSISLTRRGRRGSASKKN